MLRARNRPIGASSKISLMTETPLTAAQYNSTAFQRFLTNPTWPFFLSFLTYTGWHCTATCAMFSPTQEMTTSATTRRWSLARIPSSESAVSTNTPFASLRPSTVKSPFVKVRREKGKAGPRTTRPCHCAQIQNRCTPLPPCDTRTP